MARHHLCLPLLFGQPHTAAPLSRRAQCSSNLETPAPAVKIADETPEGASPPGLNPPRREEPLHETIMYMIRRCQWTTRLENSIRLLSPTLGIISGAVAAGRVDLALQLFCFTYRQVGFRPEPATFDLLFPTLTSRRMLNHARCLVLETMMSFSIQPDEATLASLIVAYGKAAIPQEVVKLFRMMPGLGITRTTLSYNALLDAILCRGREAMARRIYNTMIADGVTPDLSTYNTLICKCSSLRGHEGSWCRTY
jgi:pentatricopeptide repeat protein